MKRRSLLLVILILAAVCVCFAALADDYPVNPYQEEVWKFDRMSNMVGKTRAVSYYYDGKITIEVLQAPAIGQAGSWQVVVQDGLTVTNRSISIQSPDPAGGYSTEYRIKNPTSDLIESCEFVAPGVYRLIAFYDFSDGTGSVAAYQINIEEDGVHPTVTQKVNEILNECRVTGDDWQTALNLHDWLTHHAYYDYSYSFYGAEDVLLRGYGVCDSYSKAYAYLLEAAGIPQERARSEGHAWNVITLGSDEYHVDATWDDGGHDQVPISGNESHEYFCLNDELIYGFMDQDNSHKKYATVTGRCTSLAESYPIHTGEWRNYGSIYVDYYTLRNYQDLIREGAIGTEAPFTFTVQATDRFPAGQAGHYYEANTSPALYDRYFLAYGLTHAGLEMADGTLLDVDVTFDTDDLFFTVSVNVSGNVSGRCNDNISWTLTSGGKLTITGSGVIPYEMEDEWAEDFREAVTEVEIGNGITGIDYGVFSGHTNLTTVTIPASLKTIGEYAFGGCEKLTDILTPGGGDRTTFYRCYYGTVRVFTLPYTVEELGLLVFDESGYGTTVNPDMTIPANTSRIEEYAFQNTDPTYVKMTAWNVNRIEIGDHAFADCDSLRYFLIDGNGGDFDLAIANYAFAECSEDLVFIGIENEQLRQYAESHGFTYIENEEISGNG